MFFVKIKELVVIHTCEGALYVYMRPTTSWARNFTRPLFGLVCVKHDRLYTQCVQVTKIKFLKTESKRNISCFIFELWDKNAKMKWK